MRLSFKPVDQAAIDDARVSEFLLRASTAAARVVSLRQAGILGDALEKAKSEREFWLKQARRERT